MPTDEMQLHLMIDDPDADAERLDALTRRLYRHPERAERVEGSPSLDYVILIDFASSDASRDTVGDLSIPLRCAPFHLR